MISKAPTPTAQTDAGDRAILRAVLQRPLGSGAAEPAVDFQEIERRLAFSFSEQIPDVQTRLDSLAHRGLLRKQWTDKTQSFSVFPWARDALRTICWEGNDIDKAERGLIDFCRICRDHEIKPAVLLGMWREWHKQDDMDRHARHVEQDPEVRHIRVREFCGAWRQDFLDAQATESSYTEGEKTRLAAKERRIDQLEAELEVAGRERDSLKNKLRQKKEEKQELDGQVELLRTSKEKTERQIAELNKEHTGQLEKLKEQLTASESQIDDLKQRLAKAIRTKWFRRVGQPPQTLSDQENLPTVAGLRDQLASKEASLEKRYVAANDAAKALNDQISTLLEDKEQRLAAAKVSIEALRTNLDSATEQRRSLEKEQQGLLERLAKITKDREVLEEENLDLFGQLKRCKWVFGTAAAVALALAGLFVWKWSSLSRIESPSMSSQIPLVVTIPAAPTSRKPTTSAHFAPALKPKLWEVVECVQNKLCFHAGKHDKIQHCRTRETLKTSQFRKRLRQEVHQLFTKNPKKGSHESRPSIILVLGTADPTPVKQPPRKRHRWTKGLGRRRAIWGLDEVWRVVPSHEKGSLARVAVGLSDVLGKVLDSLLDIYEGRIGGGQRSIKTMKREMLTDPMLRQAIMCLARPKELEDTSGNTGTHKK